MSDEFDDATPEELARHAAYWRWMEERAKPTGPQIPMTPERLSECLTMLGWSQNHFADRIGMGDRNARRWLRGDIAIPGVISEWVETLVDFLNQHPAPQGWRSQGRHPMRAEI